MVSGEDAVEIISWAESLGIEVRLDGGWGVDALLGEQSRIHEDIDLFIGKTEGPGFAAFLCGKGFREVEREFTTSSHTVWEDDRGRIVDLHLYERDEDGSYVFEGADYPAETFGACGRIAGKQVRCIPPEQQVLFHRGYDFDDTDVRDVLLLCGRFGIPVPEEYRERAEALRSDTNK